MASTKQLLKDMIVTIDRGVWEGYLARVIDPKVAPKGHEHQRCILVNIPDVGDVWVLPRLLKVGDHTVAAPPTLSAHPLEQAALTLGGSILTTDPITDPMDPALDRFRPSAHIVKEYVSRILPGGQRDVDVLLAMRDDRHAGFIPNIALVGETQSGKTMLVQVLAVLAAERDGMPKPYPVFTLNGSIGITNYEMFGQTTAIDTGHGERLVWLEGLVPMALRCGGILYLDEWNAVNPAQATAIHPVLDARRQFVNTRRAIPDGHGGWMPEVVQAAPSTWVIATINPGYKGTQTMAEASTNRFSWIPWDYDADTEERLIPSATVRMLGKALRDARTERSITVPVGTSALVSLSHTAAKFGADFALWAFAALFPVNERSRVNYILEDMNIVDILRAEYPNPTSAPVADTPQVDTEPF
jgi:MoxR-like ATPase